METEKYTNLWKKYLPVIRIQLKNSLKSDEIIQLSKIEFEVAGDRKLSTYAFNLEIQKGKVTNDISGTAVARDLYQVLNNDKICIQFFKDKKIKINMGESYILKFRAALI